MSKSIKYKKGFIHHSKPLISNNNINAVKHLLNKNSLLDNKITSKFEYEVAKYLSVNFAISTSSGTSALILALQVLNIEKNDEVIIPSYVCEEVLNAVKFVGATAVISDVTSNWIMSKNEIKPLITRKTKAIIAVHIYGLPVDIKSLKIFKIPIIEDACQALGMKIRDKMAGTIGDMGFFSFDPTKCLTTIRGGMLVANKKFIIKKIESMKQNSRILFNTLHIPMSAIQSVLGLSQLSQYESFLRKRYNMKNKYSNKLSKYKNIKIVNEKFNFLYRFPIKIFKDFNLTQKKFINKKIHVRRGVDTLLHRISNLKDNNFPNSTLLYNNTLSIPFYPALTINEQNYILNSTIEILNEN